MITVIRCFRFDAAHRVLGHESRCKWLHGHSYLAEVTVKAPQLDELDRVVDFGVLKEVVGKWIEENFDHNTLLHRQDPLLRMDQSIVFGRSPYVMPNGNPTAENIAKVLFGVVSSLLPTPLEVVKIKVWETPNCAAEYVPDDSKHTTD